MDIEVLVACVVVLAIKGRGKRLKWVAHWQHIGTARHAEDATHYHIWERERNGTSVYTATIGPDVPHAHTTGFLSLQGLLMVQHLTEFFFDQFPVTKDSLTLGPHRSKTVL